MLQFVLMAAIVVLGVVGPAGPSSDAGGSGRRSVARVLAGALVVVLAARALGSGLTPFPRPATRRQLVERRAVRGRAPSRLLGRHPRLRRHLARALAVGARRNGRPRRRLGAQGAGRGALPRGALPGVRRLLRAHAATGSFPSSTDRREVGCGRGRGLAGARRTGVLLPPRIGSRGAHPRVPRRHADRAGRGRRGRLRARPDREVARARLRRAAGRRASFPATAAAIPQKVARAVDAELCARREGAGGGGRHRLRARRRRAVSAPEDRRRCSWSARSTGTRSSGRAPDRHGTCVGDQPERARATRRGRGRWTSSRSEPTILRDQRRADSMQETEKIWMNGELVDWADAKIHVASHGLNYGSGVFEGIRCYDTPKGPAVFRLTDHLVRLRELGEGALHGPPVHDRGDPLRDARASSRPTGSRPATCGRSRSTATASSACRRRGIRSTS